MIKRMIAMVLSLLLTFTVFTYSSTTNRMTTFAADEQPPLQTIQTNVPELAPQANSAILVESNSGKILYGKQLHKPVAIASVTKVMTTLLALEAIARGELKLSDKVTASQYASSMEGTRLYLAKGDVYSVDDLLRGVMMISGNDAAIAIAEHIAGSEQAFVARMNERARQLGMKNSKFANPHGLPVLRQLENHYSTAYDVAVMSRELLKYEKVFEYTSKSYHRFYLNDGKLFEMNNSNPLLGKYKGVDGLKTGFTNLALHCLVASAKRDGMRLITVVLGEPTKIDRANETAAMLDYGFQQYKPYSFIKKGEPVGIFSIYKGVKSRHVLRAPTDYQIIVEKNDNLRDFHYRITLDHHMPAPIEAGTKIGKIEIYKKQKMIETRPILMDISVAKARFFDHLGFVFRTLFFAEKI